MSGDLGIAQIIGIAVLAALLGTSLYTDLKLGKIYNKLTAPCMVAGLALNYFSFGIRGLLWSIEGMGLILLLFFVFAPLAGLGGGDTKLLMAVGALVGIKMTVWVLIFASIIGGVLALVVMIRNRIVVSTVSGMAKGAYLGLFLRQPMSLSNGSSGVKFRYSPAIALGTILAFLLKF